MKQKIMVSLLAVMLMVVSVFITGCEETATGTKEITVTVVFADKSEKVYEIETEAESLGDAMFEEKLITEKEYKSGFYTKIAGVKADYSVDKSWWCITKDGKMTTVGMNDQPIADGDEFEITYTIG